MSKIEVNLILSFFQVLNLFSELVIYVFSPVTVNDIFAVFSSQRGMYLSILDFEWRATNELVLRYVYMCVSVYVFFLCLCTR